MTTATRLFLASILVLATTAYAQLGQDAKLTPEEVQRLHRLQVRILDIPGIHGVSGGARGRLTIYVDKKWLTSPLEGIERAVRPIVASLAFADPVIHWIFIGEIKAEAAPVPMGSSTSNTGGCFTGTLGVTAKLNGEIGYVTSNHVAAAERNRLCPNTGNAKTQGSPASGDPGQDCKDGDTIGRLLKWQPIDVWSTKVENVVDAAFVRGTGVTGKNRCGIVWTANAVDPTMPMRVKKCGATDKSPTFGEIVDLNAAVIVRYRGGFSVKFFHQIMIKGDSGSMFSKPGDSGSAIFTETGDVVGLLMAGASGTAIGEKWTVANPMKEVKKELGIELCPDC